MRRDAKRMGGLKERQGRDGGGNGKGDRGNGRDGTGHGMGGDGKGKEEKGGEGLQSGANRFLYNF